MTPKETRDYLRSIGKTELSALERILDRGARRMQSDLAMVRRELKRRKRKEQKNER